MIITALDYPSAKEALAFVDKVDPTLTRLKVGNELFTRAGPALVEQLHKKGFEIFLDSKFHDIPNTVSRAVSAAASLGVWMVNVHASGGPRMLEAARKAVPAAGASGGTRLIGVTVLTSFDECELQSVGVSASTDEQVRQLTQLTIDQGLDGVVCSAHEVAHMRSYAPINFITVTPGIRPNDSSVANDDQRRVMTPIEAKQAGSSYLVIGRAITQAAEPIQVLEKISNDLR